MQTGEEEERGRWGEVNTEWDRRRDRDASGELGVLLGRRHSCRVVRTTQEKTSGLWILVHTLSFIFWWEFMEFITSRFLSYLRQ